MFTTLIVQPIFNLLVLIYAIIPGHNFGLAIIIFTIIIRMLMWPLVKKQLHHARAIRELQPEIKKIKAATKGDRQKEMQLTTELYKEKEINPFASMGIILVQIPILLGLFIGLKKIIDNKQQIVEFTYPFIQDLSWMQTLAQDIHQFDNTLFGIIDLSKPALGNEGLYIPALILVAASAIMQYLQSKQLMPKDKDSRSLRQILSEAGQGKSADQSEVQAAVGRGTLYIIPAFVFIFSIGFAAALPLYWLTSSSVAYLQQSKILKDDAREADDAADKALQKADAETTKKAPRKKAKKTSKNKRRRK